MKIIIFAPDAPMPYIEVEAEEVAPGLAINRMVTVDGSATDEWAITHVPSGHALMQEIPHEAAIGLATAFSKLADWTMNYTQLTERLENDLELRAALKKAQWQFWRDLADSEP